MEYICPVCGKKVASDLKAYIGHTEGHIVDIIKTRHPEWIEKDGLCDKCLDYYRRQIKGDSAR